MNVVRLSNAQVVGVTGVQRSGAKLVIQINSIITTHIRSHYILDYILQIIYSLKYNLLNQYYNYYALLYSQAVEVTGMAGQDMQLSTSLANHKRLIHNHWTLWGVTHTILILLYKFCGTSLIRDQGLQSHNVQDGS